MSQQQLAQKSRGAAFAASSIATIPRSPSAPSHRVARRKASSEMPLDPTTYLTRQGWGGIGMPLDGAGGKGLKKPIAVPSRRGFSGVGKDRDRAVEWWDCLFEASAKTLKLGTPGSSVQSSQAASPAPTPSPADPSSSATTSSSSAATLTTLDSDGSVAGTSASLSLQALARRQHARRQLMSGFVRGRIPPAEIVKEATPATPAPSDETLHSGSTEEVAKSSTPAKEIDAKARKSKGKRRRSSDENDEGLGRKEKKSKSKGRDKDEKSKSMSMSNKPDISATSQPHSSVDSSLRKKRRREEKEAKKEAKRAKEERRAARALRRVEKEAKKEKEKDKKSRRKDAVKDEKTKKTKTSVKKEHKIE